MRTSHDRKGFPATDSRSCYAGTSSGQTSSLRKAQDLMTRQLRRPTKTGVGPRAEATVRAYRSDLRDIAEFVSDGGSTRSLDDLDDRHLFAYLVYLVRSGRSTSTIRRRLTALRSYVSDRQHPTLTVAGLHSMERRFLTSPAGPTSTLVISDDAIVREGLAALLGRQGVLTWPEVTSSAMFGGTAVWDYVLVWLPSRRGIDPFSSVDWVAAASTTGVPVVALYPTRITDLVRLRLAEAGARYALPQWWLANRVDELHQLLETATLPTRFHLETPLAIRQRLGLRLSGQLAPLLEAASEVDPAVWRSTAQEEAPRLGRSKVQRLRQIANDEAGIPPTTGRYSTAVRNAPTTPDWRDVRRIVRLAFNLS